MSPRKKSFPKYPANPHKSGQARIVIGGRHYYLGKFNSDSSWREYEKLLAEWNRAQGQGQDQPFHLETAQVKTVGSLVVRFLEYARSHYAGGKEFAEYQNTLKPFLYQHQKTPLDKFGPVALKRFRETLIDGSWVNHLPEDKKKVRLNHPKTIHLSRKVINQRIERIKRIFKWGASEELFPLEVYLRLKTVSGLQAHRSAARERPKILPVAEEVVEATLPFLNPLLRDMVQVQRLTGMRPGEIVQLSWSEIDRVGVATEEGVRIWVFQPKNYKTSFKNRGGQIALGPRAQKILKDYEGKSGFLFDPRTIRRNSGSRYSTASYGRAIARAARKAGIQPWHPHQLRHSAAQQIEREFSLDDARAVLRHTDPNVTTIYTTRDLKRAAEIVAELG